MLNMSCLVVSTASFIFRLRMGCNSDAHANIFRCAPDVFPMRTGKVNQPYLVTKPTVYKK